MEAHEGVEIRIINILDMVFNTQYQLSVCYATKWIHLVPSQRNAHIVHHEEEILNARSRLHSEAVISGCNV
jgi:hypothetical protein